MQEKDTNTETLILEAAKKGFVFKDFGHVAGKEIAVEAGKISIASLYFRPKKKTFEAFLMSFSQILS